MSRVIRYFRRPDHKTKHPLVFFFFLPSFLSLYFVVVAAAAIEKHFELSSYFSEGY